MIRSNFQLIVRQGLFLTAFGLLIFNACKKSDTAPDVDCSTVTGATFTTNSGKMASILSTKCGTGTACHGQGSSYDWQYTGNYDDMKTHFSHMYSETVLDKAMPPKGSTQLTQEEINQFECWKQSSFPK